ncbi:uncharacterized protein syt15 isoform X2 [Vanacampus margaritifer]
MVPVGLTAGLLVLLFFILLLLGLVTFCLLRRKRRRDRRQYQELVAAAPHIPACAPLAIPVSQGSYVKPDEIPFTLPARFTTPQRETEEKAEVIKMESHRDILAHRGSLSVQSWYPVGTVLAGLYSGPGLSEVVAPPPGMATRLCFSVEYRHSGEQLAVSLLRLGNLPPRFHGNVTLVQLRLLPDDRRPRQAKARGTGPDPEFNDFFVFQVSAARVSRSTLSVCVLSVAHDGKRHAVGQVLFPLQGELGQAGRLLWRDLDTEKHHCSELGDVLVSLSYNPTLQRLSVEVPKARGMQRLADAGARSSRWFLHTQRRVTHFNMSSVPRRARAGEFANPHSSGENQEQRRGGGGGRRAGLRAQDELQTAGRTRGRGLPPFGGAAAERGHSLSLRPTGICSVGAIYVRQGSTAAALDGYGQRTTSTGQTVAWTLHCHLKHTCGVCPFMENIFRSCLTQVLMH